MSRVIPLRRALPTKRVICMGRRSRIIDNLRNLPFAPGVQMQHVPSISVGKAIGVRTTTTAAGNEDVDFELDAKIRGRPIVAIVCASSTFG